jgi:hypothetical protein
MTKLFLMKLACQNNHKKSYKLNWLKNIDDNLKRNPVNLWQYVFFQEKRQKSHRIEFDGNGLTQPCEAAEACSLCYKSFYHRLRDISADFRSSDSLPEHPSLTQTISRT